MLHASSKKINKCKIKMAALPLSLDVVQNGRQLQAIDIQLKKHRKN